MAAAADVIDAHGLRGPVDGLARHGADGPRDQAARGAHFGRMFGWLPEGDLGQEAIDELAEALTRNAGRSTDNLDVPAGYTYFGQFVDHDITFDPTSRLARDNDPDALVDFRTPRFDLDSLYGSGPLDQPFLYDWETGPQRGVRLLLGANGTGDGFAAVDLPRNAQGRALAGDARNDENLIVSQLHLLFIRFHNKVVEQVIEDGSGRDGASVFERAQRIVRWHYQWLVVNDLLPKLVGADLAGQVLHPGEDDDVTLEHFSFADRPFMPVEFSGAAYRFGHSMVREDYKLNAQGNVPVFSPRGRNAPHLGGFRRLPADLEIEWEHFFALTDTVPQCAKKLDTSLSKALGALPPDHATLARLNLLRGQALGLPAGLDVATAMDAPRLSREQLLDPVSGIGDETAEALIGATPLWYYVLCEAQALPRDGNRLGPVGGRIVAEVLVGLLYGDPLSYLRVDPTWTPELPARDGSFTMSDLVRFALS